jgi:1-deoxy-D-xylulose-5-phosphate reductoisomerase
VLNAADEVAVAAFLDRRIGFLDIARVVAETLERMDRTQTAAQSDDVLEAARAADATARRVADDAVSALMARA